jgi:hypothetical protein
MAAPSPDFADALTTINAPVTLGFHDNSGGNTFYFGALSGTNPNAAFYDQYAGAPTVSIGSLNLSTTFAGQFQTSVNVTKTGTGTDPERQQHAHRQHDREQRHPGGDRQLQQQPGYRG